MVIRVLAILCVSSALVACGAREPAPGAIAAPAHAETPPTTVITEGLPALMFGPLLVNPGGFDVGIIEPNTTSAVRMTLTNTAPEPMTIVFTASDCKCTLPQKLDGTVIPAGESIPMNATFSLHAVPGVKEAKMQVSFRVGQQPIQTAIVSIKGEVAMAVRAVPAYVDALKGVTTGTVRVASADGRPFRVISAGGEPPQYAGGFDPARDEPRTSYTLRWEVDYPTNTDDCHGERLWWAVETDHPGCPVLPLRIRHECTGLLMDETYPQRGWLFQGYLVNAGAVRAGEAVDLDIDVRRLQERVTTGINGAESLTPGATVEFLGIMEPPDADSTVRIRFTPHPGTEGMMYAMANIKSATGDKEIAILARVLRVAR